MGVLSFISLEPDIVNHPNFTRTICTATASKNLQRVSPFALSSSIVVNLPSLSIQPWTEVLGFGAQLALTRGFSSFGQTIQNKGYFTLTWVSSCDFCVSHKVLPICTLFALWDDKCVYDDTVLRISSQCVPIGVLLSRQVHHIQIPQVVSLCASSILLSVLLLILPCKSLICAEINPQRHQY